MLIEPFVRMHEFQLISCFTVSVSWPFASCIYAYPSYDPYAHPSYDLYADYDYELDMLTTVEPMPLHFDTCFYFTESDLPKNIY
jgi:hypothetical protein